MEGSDILHELDEVEFSRRLRGYAPLEVDELLERARAEISDLRSRAQAADERVRSSQGELEVELTSAAVARGEAEAVLASAKDEAERLVAGARTEAKRLVDSSEVEIREAIESGRNRLLEEIAVLKSRRDEAHDAIDLAERQVAAHRDRVMSALDDLRTLTEGLSILPGAPNTDRLVRAKLGSPREGVEDSVALPTTEGDPTGVVRRIDIPSPSTQTEGSEDSVERVSDLSRPVGGPAAVEVVPAEDTEGWSGAGRS